MNTDAVSCKVDFVLPEAKATEYIAKLVGKVDKIILDETNDKNVRYIGADPSNYVLFNGELWRIIGVMKDVADENGTIESRLKIWRNSSIGKFKFDNKEKGMSTSSETYPGTNKWSISQLMMMLNPETRIPEDHTIDENGYVLDSEGYKVFKQPGSYYHRTNGYKPAEATTSHLLEQNVSFSSSLNNSEYTKNCESWLKDGTISPDEKDGMIYNDIKGSSGVAMASDVYPVVYLNTNLKIIGGNGTRSNPFILIQ